MSSLTIEERNIILIQGLDFFAASLSGIFVSVYIFINSDLRTTLSQLIVMNLSFIFFYMASGWAFKKIQAATLIKTSLLTSTIYFLILFVLKEKAVQYIIPLSIFSGFGGGIYWAAFNLNQYALSNKDSRVKYFGWSHAVFNGFQAIAPILGGAIIAITGEGMLFGVKAGYSVLFLIVSLIYLFMFILFQKLPKHDPIYFSLRHILEHKKSKLWLNVLGQQFLYGMYDVIYGSMVGILIFLIVKGEFILGVIQTLSFLACSIGSILVIKILHRNQNAFWIGIIGQMMGIIMFALNQNIVGIIFYIITGFITPFLNTWLSTVSFKTLDQDNRHISEKYYLLAEQVFVLLFARILSNFLVFILISFGDQVHLAKLSLFLLPIFPLLIGFLLNNYSKSVVKI